MFFPDYYSGRYDLKDQQADWNYQIFRHIGRSVFFDYAEKMSKETTIEAGRDYELVLNKRIDDVVAKNETKFITDDLKNMCSLNHVLLSIMSEEIFRNDPLSKIYKVSPNFIKALTKIQDKVRFELIPDSFSGFIPIPKEMFKVQNGSKYLTGVYIKSFPVGSESNASDIIDAVGKDDKLNKALLLKSDYRQIIVTSYASDESSSGVEYGQFSNTLQIQVKDGDFISDVVTRSPNNTPLKLKNINQFYSFIINIICYVHSLEPDVSMFKPSHLLTANENKKLEREFEPIDTSYPTVFVSWSYGKDRTYNVDSTWVDSHLRWQRCGPGHKDTKLIMVEGHERTYKNVKEQDENSIRRI